jgi:hypothetical protein
MVNGVPQHFGDGSFGVAGLAFSATRRGGPLGCPNATLRSMAELPLGTVTFFFTDIEGSTRLWEERPDAMPAASGAPSAQGGAR